MAVPQQRRTHHTTMEKPHVLLLKAAARLNADGHFALAQDIHQLARKWTPHEYQETVNDTSSSPVFVPLQQQHPLQSDT